MTAPAERKLKIGVLALQGAFSEHVNLLKRIQDEVSDAVLIKTQSELEDPSLDALILPGGESTSMALVAERSGLMEPLRKWVKGGRPVWGTCAGMILLSNAANKTKIGGQSLIGGLDVTVQRNAFGTQLDSFVEDLSGPLFGPTPFQAVFIRAPIIDTIDSDAVEVLVTVDHGGKQVPVAVRQGSILATAFHPELTHDDRVHRYFLDMARKTINKV
ncbi:PdxT/SNO family [Blyttiomyces helicus]|uniref:glutaminase n=1 Tax=Blyttiomyces helicus TaxID=388810 RepID=A0A4P9WDY9_9FUNG|nr:PdxT/SNO family [Blyttiomyces helicus]|eukprot:RKO90931.1 PdxT/SNO family [Blyttiomyces helicus]